MTIWPRVRADVTHLVACGDLETPPEMRARVIEHPSAAVLKIHVGDELLLEATFTHNDPTATADHIMQVLAEATRADMTR